ncbi:biotin/lipoyl-containing protein [Devosia lacusdianchii]|uniref:biotin/lipoyl-containing protein n=1 Tax=Devosia lacusdianchii TaxID=2917991 RepID=UPI003B845AA2
MLAGDRFDLVVEYLAVNRRWQVSRTDKNQPALSAMVTWSETMRLATLTWADRPGRRFVLKVEKTASGYRIRHGGADFKVMVLQPHVADLLPLMPVKVPPDMSRFLLCPMPGQVVRVDVVEGEIVEDGQVLAVVEAMKMENVLKAQKRARVSKVHVSAGAVLAVDQVMVEFEAV